VTLSPTLLVTLRMVSGVAIWALHFTAIVTFVALACARGLANADWLGIGVVAWGVGAATAIALAAAALVVVSSLRRPVRGFADWLGASVTALAALAIIWEALPAMLVEPCG
jgi:hypothetical protein